MDTVAEIAINGAQSIAIVTGDKIAQQAGISAGAGIHASSHNVTI